VPREDPKAHSHVKIKIPALVSWMFSDSGATIRSRQNNGKLEQWANVKKIPKIYHACVPRHTVHKLNDCLHPMECIPETQFVMRSKIHLAVLLHLQCKCEREEDSQFGQILL